MATFRKLASGHWQARVWHPGLKRQVTLGFTHPLKRVMQEAAADAEQQIRRGEWIDPKRGDVTLGEWWDRWVEMRSVEESTARKDISRWRSHVAPAFGDWSLSAIGSEDVETWVADMRRRGVGAETVGASLRLLRQMLQAAVKHQRLRNNAADDVTAPAPPPHEDRILSPREGKQLRMQFGGVDRLIVDTFLGTGLRWEELAALQVYRLHLAGRNTRLDVRRKVDRRGAFHEYAKSTAGWRTVPLSRRLARKLARHTDGKKPNDLVFTTPGGGHHRRVGDESHLWYDNWRGRVWEPSVARAGLRDPQPTIHDMRHTWCSELANAGMPLPELKVISGHGRVASLERYLHASPARLDRARRLLDGRHGVGTPALAALDGDRREGGVGREKTRPDLRRDQTG